MIIRRLVKSRIADDQVKEYLRIHNSIPEEAFQEFYDAGIICISCFVDGYDLYVYQEVDTEKQAANQGKPSPKRKAIAESLVPVKDHTVPLRPIQEVFRIEREEK